MSRMQRLTTRSNNNNETQHDEKSIMNAETATMDGMARAEALVDEIMEATIITCSDDITSLTY
jgi:hypothetical protein